MSKAKISILIPICNVENYLKQCLDSVVEQSLKDIEIICIDDGSKDSSPEIIESYAKKDSRIKVITKPNSGYGNSMNRGLAAATGEYIGIVESDDWIPANMYQELWDLTDNGRIDIVKSNFYDCYEEEGHIRKILNAERIDMPANGTEFTVRHDPRILLGHPSIWSAIYRRDFLKEHDIHFMEEPGGGWVDNPFFFETLFLAKSVIWTNKPYYFYRKTNPNSSSNKQTDLTLPIRRMMDNLDVMEKYHFYDEDVERYLYARALQYVNGVEMEKHYTWQQDQVMEWARKLMNRLNENVVEQYFSNKELAAYYRHMAALSTNCPKSGKVLIYNWIPFDNPKKYGGGVTIYCKNLISALIKYRPDIDVYFISSGWTYDLSTTECYIRSIENEFGKNCKSFEVVNSPVPAAQNLLLNNPSLAFSNPTLVKVFGDFMEKQGKFDVVHWNNIEGLSFDTLGLKKQFKDTKFIYSMHNYVPICPTGFYYNREELCNCSPNHTAEQCEKCTSINRRKNISQEIALRASDGPLLKGKKMDSVKWCEEMDFNILDTVGTTALFKEFTDKAVAAINENVDLVLAVADRVKELAIENGIDESKVVTSYIGTKIAEHQIHQSIADNKDYFRLAYLGSDVYFCEKGYPFLLESLSKLPDDVKNKMELVLTTTNGDESTMKKKLGSAFHKITIIKGYTHAQLKSILKDCHLGVVPVLWEDNLPQIAIEMSAIGVPVLASNFGGAHELCKNPLFVFNGGDEEDFLQHLTTLVEKPELLEEYWKSSMMLVTMEKHMEEIEKHFAIPKQENVTMSLEMYSALIQQQSFIDQLNLPKKKKVQKKWVRIVTFIPRKIKGFVLCTIQHGFWYTVRRTGQHLTGKA